MKKINVMHVVQGLDIGGLERLVIDLIESSDKDRFDFFVCCLSQDGILAEELERNKIPVIALNKQSGFNLRISFALAKIIKDKKIDILHTHSQRPRFYGALTKLLVPNVKIVHTQHGYDPKRYRSLLLSRFAASFIDQIVLVSKALYDFALLVEKTNKDKLMVIYNGINLKKFTIVINQKQKEELKKSLGISLGDYVIGTVGRLEEVKNHKLLIRVFSQISLGKKNVKLLIVGGGPLFKELKDYANQQEVVDKVILTGARHDVEQLLDIIDVFALSSLSEGTSLVVLEAMAKGLPVVATDVGGVRELVSNIDNGFLVSLTDEDSFVRGINDLLNDQELYRKVSVTNSKKASLEFGIKNTAIKYEEVYNKVLNKQ